MPDGGVWKNIVTRGEAEGRRDARRVPRQLQIQSARPATCAPSTPKCRCWRSGTTTRSPTTGRPSKSLDRGQALHREVACRCSPRARRAPSTNSCRSRATPQEAARVYRKVAYGPLLDVFFLDMRSYRGPNTDNSQDESRAGDRVPRARAARLAQARADGLARDLEGDRRRHAARPDRVRRRRREEGLEAVAQGDGPALGRELEIAELLSFIKHAGIRNTVWLTADVHYTAAHYYDPNKAQFQDFEPFWEFVSGPIACRHFGPGAARQHVRAAAALREGAAPRAGRRTCRRASACSSSATWRSTAPAR